MKEIIKEKGKLQNAHLSTGLFGQYHRQACDMKRKNAVYKDIESCEEPSKCDEYNLELKEAYASVNERYRLPLELYYSQGFKMREIAEILSLPVNTIKTRISRGRKELEEYYRGC